MADESRVAIEHGPDTLKLRIPAEGAPRDAGPEITGFVVWLVAAPAFWLGVPWDGAFAGSWANAIVSIVLAVAGFVLFARMMTRLFSYEIVAIDAREFRVESGSPLTKTSRTVRTPVLRDIEAIPMGGHLAALTGRGRAKGEGFRRGYLIAKGSKPPITFGFGIDSDDAARIVAAILARFPGLGPSE